MNALMKIQEAFPSGIIKASELNAIGISNSSIRNYVLAGKLLRVRHGYYVLADGESELCIIRKVLPEGVLCMETALYYYGYSDVTPRIFDISVPRGISRSRLQIDGISIRPHYTADVETGLSYIFIDGAELRIYNRERVICDCLRRKNTMDYEMFCKALRLYAEDSAKDIRRLAEYANRFHVTKKVMDYMGALLNG